MKIMIKRNSKESQFYWLRSIISLILLLLFFILCFISNHSFSAIFKFFFFFTLFLSFSSSLYCSDILFSELQKLYCAIFVQVKCICILKGNGMDLVKPHKRLSNPYHNMKNKSV